MVSVEYRPPATLGRLEGRQVLMLHVPGTVLCDARHPGLVYKCFKRLQKGPNGFDFRGVAAGLG